ncbi:MAG: hypothetical protein A2Y28_00265 [Chlamydiae bacterium GWC2_50_10]|nr:MAG: hypothetical protein A2Z85_03830 [Chlamydiae bacterium GWA2_50_15]OGN54305.1 MAG: hypothetical protein A2098_02195 [Chlamydiae bacterium GWF2_49_8]OGN54588.1 MAG: hypothetical protein A2Y28_00265 [Chlamydiae bacterium GWC2_50_10]OGN63344.1 MAG: hypothetical protein A3E26_00275 [Chlamydiae bacterium RIFCSPHIGHO2_12_FULL_49_32]OGN69671.1 MAG: hypothetical protein A3I15_02155 [Chlamydiae bacterium RIFCSPLOWO2_02_FULL_49_12]OGN75171.1 MAG: hypothetical protein A3G30_00140 [Chlamydiae bacte
MPSRTALTIGFFDGVHLGHQDLIRHARARAGSKGTVVAVTFTRHPSLLFKRDSSLFVIYPFEKKLSLLKEAGCDRVLALEFNAKLAELSPKAFLLRILEEIPFSYLILGQGACFGKERRGDENEIKALQKELSFVVEYLPRLTQDGVKISSGVIRSLILQKEFEKASALLGRPYC